MNIDISIANTLKKSRKEHGYSLKEVAEMVGRSDKSVSSWETGRTQPDIPTLIKLCEIYNIKSFDSFLDRKSVARSSSVDSLFQHLTDNYHRLNDTGKGKLVAYKGHKKISEILDIPRISEIVPSVEMRGIEPLTS